MKPVRRRCSSCVPVAADVPPAAATLIPALVAPAIVIGWARPASWVEPAMTTASVMSGSGEASVIVCAPPRPIAKLIESRPAVEFALVIAVRSDPAPASAVVLTVKIAAGRWRAGRA